MLQPCQHGSAAHPARRSRRCSTQHLHPLSCRAAVHVDHLLPVTFTVMTGADADVVHAEECTVAIKGFLADGIQLCRWWQDPSKRYAQGRSPFSLAARIWDQQHPHGGVGSPAPRTDAADETGSI